MNQSEPLPGKQISKLLRDRQGRQVSYLRLAVTQRCNLRCRYCLTEDGVTLISHDEILRYEEMERLVRLFRKMGIDKVRLTGGEPFVRRGFMEFLNRLVCIFPAERIFITSNGIALKPHLECLKEMGIGGINLSLDSLDSDRFLAITRRDSFCNAWLAMQTALDMEIPLKVNVVVMNGVNDNEIPRFVALARNRKVSVRFIELMPFSGGNKIPGNRLDADAIKLIVEQEVASPVTWIQKGTALEVKKNEWLGSVGIIASGQRKFCGSCNRIRITPSGGLQTCLYGAEVFNLRKMIRAGADDERIAASVHTAVADRFQDGFEAEQTGQGSGRSMSIIGG